MVFQWDGEDGGASQYADLPWAAHNAETGVLSVNDRTSRMSSRIEIAAGTHVVIDYGAIFVGYIKYRPKFSAIMRLAHEGMPDMPVDTEYRRGLQFQLLVEGIGQTFFSTNAVFNDNQLGRYLSVFRRAPQAIVGQLPIYKLCRSDPITLGDRTFYPIKLELVSWMDRDPDLFGTRIVPPPRGRGPTAVLVPAAPAPLPLKDNGAAEKAPGTSAPFDGGVPVAAATPSTAPVQPTGGPVAAPPAAAGTPKVPDPFEIFRRPDNSATPTTLPPTRPAA